MYRLPTPFIAILAGLTLSSSAGPAEAAVKNARPKGTVKVNVVQLQTHGKVTCARVAGSWVPGKRLQWVPRSRKAERYFISHARQAKNYAKQAKKQKGKLKRRSVKQARAFEALAKHQRATCAALEAVKKLAPEPAPTPVPVPVAAAPLSATPLRFALQGARGLALAQTGNGRRGRTTGTNSNLVAVTDTGAVVDAVSSGRASVSRFILGPPGKVYVVFASRVSLDGTMHGPSCLLAEVAVASGEPTCIDGEPSYLHGTPLMFHGANPAVQTDARGAVYYAGATSDGRTVLRKYEAGAKRDLLADHVSLRDFLVMHDGTVMVAGSTQATMQDWTRRIAPSGALSSVVSSTAQFMRAFPDGGVYLGVWGGHPSVRRFDPANQSLDPMPWITNGGSGIDAHFDTRDLCDPVAFTGFCNTAGAMVRSFAATPDGRVYGLAGMSGPHAGQLAQYFPVVTVPPTPLANVLVLEGAGNELVLAGLDAGGRNSMVRLDPRTDAATTLLGATNEVEIYHMNYLADMNRLMFDGLRFSDNAYVLGTVDLATNEVTFTNTMSSKWEDFQTFE